MEFIWWKCEKEKGKERKRQIILNKQIPSSAPCKDFLPWPLTNLTWQKKRKHIWFSSSSFEKSCEVDLSPECQYFPFPIFSEFENSQAEPLTTTLTFLPAIFLTGHLSIYLWWLSKSVILIHTLKVPLFNLETESIPGLCGQWTPFSSSDKN